jgi:RNA-directed DNA polymerase
MTAALTAGAVSHTSTDWQTISWQAIHETVRRLQARIVKATQAGKWGKVKALQRLLTHSFGGKALAVRRVTENQGKHTPGVDGDIWDTPAKKATAIHALRQYGYHALPLRRVYIEKRNGKLRPLGIPTMFDRAMQALYLLALDPVAEVQADPNSYGFRKERSCADAIEQTFKVLSKRTSAQWIFEGDIAACFDKIDHNWLETHAHMDKTILHQWLKAGFIDKHALQPTQEGTPQGGICSPVLANLTLDGLEKCLRDKFPKTTRSGQQAKVHLVRYADDFIITAASQALLENEVKPLVETFLHERGLALSPDKTHITHITDGFDFLGQNIRQYSNGKLIIKPSRQNIKTFLTNIRAVIKGHAQTPTGQLIALLNPKIRGWANYHRHVVSKQTFAKVDTAIFRALWRWAKRRHPNKNRHWLKHTYFRTDPTRRWVFYAELDGKLKTLQFAVDTPIIRHTKVKGEANPYDPAWEIYFEQRLGVKMANNLRQRRQLLHLWKEQNGICPVCNQKITKLTGWHNHHIVWRTHGGSDTANNRVLLHPTCHHQLHRLGLTVVKPRPSRGV